MPFTGILGILGGNEMGAACRPFDDALLDAAGHPASVAVVPAAVVQNGSVPKAMAQARKYFGALGLEVRHVELHRRSDASSAAVVGALRESSLTYLLGGDPGYLLETLRATPAWGAIGEALAAGGALAGSSAGAMVMAETLLLRSRNPSPRARHGKDALDILPGTVVIPHLNNFGDAWLESARREAGGRDILGLDEATGLVYSGGWTAHGPGVVKLWRLGEDPPVVRRGGDRLRWRSPRGG
ncbi:MAG: cyanophycinase [Chloroflexota bacterium]|jgi:cyanophycinase|nr:cyanophycinase [Chloroflexota bacterium]